MKKVLFTLLTILFFCVFLPIISRCENNLPEWMNQFPKETEKLNAIGFGNTKAEALSKALSGISQSIKEYIKKTNDSTQIDNLVYLQKFGNVNISSLVKTFQLSEQEKNESSVVTKILYSDGNKKMLLKYFFEENNEKNNDKIYYNYSVNLSFIKKNLI